MRRRMPHSAGAFAFAAAFLSLHTAADAFSFAPQPSRQTRDSGLRSSRPPGRRADNDTNGYGDDFNAVEWTETEEGSNMKQGRREFLSLAAAPVLLSAPFPALSVTNEPTRIELTVDTEYLIRVLNYFDGDMRKVLGVLVRAPQTTVEISPPSRGVTGIAGEPNLSPKDAILRALYSYSSPDDYVTQASWLKVDEPNRGWIEFLTKKRYKLYLPTLGTGDVEGGYDGEKMLEVSIVPTNLNLSNLEAGVGLAAMSYPLAYSYYNYESYKEEQEKLKKKTDMAAKKAAKGKGAASATGVKGKGTATKGDGDAVKAVGEKKGPPAMKGQEAKKVAGVGKKPVPVKKTTSAPKVKDIAAESIEDKVAAEMLDSRRENFIAAKNLELQEEQVATEMLDSRRENFIASKNVERWKAQVAAGMIDSRQVKVNPAASAEQKGQPAIEEAGEDVNELERLIADVNDAASKGATTNLRPSGDDVEPKRGLFNNYLDSL